MNDLCRRMPRGVTRNEERARGIGGVCSKDKNRQNRVLSPSCIQQEISDSRDYGSSVIVGCSCFRRGSRRNGSLTALSQPPYSCRTFLCRIVGAYLAMSRRPAQDCFLNPSMDNGRAHSRDMLYHNPRPPPYKPGFPGWHENLAASFSGYFFNNQLFFTS